MCQHNRSFLRVLLLLLILVAGHLQAQILYTCAEIESTVGMATHNASDMDTYIQACVMAMKNASI